MTRSFAATHFSCCSYPILIQDVCHLLFNSAGPDGCHEIAYADANDDDGLRSAGSTQRTAAQEYQHHPPLGDIFGSCDVQSIWVHLMYTKQKWNVTKGEFPHARLIKPHESSRGIGNYQSYGPIFRI